jgi:hypothetical protein
MSEVHVLAQQRLEPVSSWGRMMAPVGGDCGMRAVLIERSGWRVAVVVVIDELPRQGGEVAGSGVQR